MDAHDVRACQELILAHVSEAHFIIEACMLSTCVNKDVHVESLSSTAHILADIPEANQADGTATDSPTVCKHTFVPISSLEHIDSFGDAAVDAKY